jgi:hypothetical protein
LAGCSALIHPAAGAAAAVTRVCSKPAPPSKIAALVLNGVNALEWALGIGPDNKSYGGNSVQSREMMNAPGVNDARAYYLNRFGTAISAGAVDLTGKNVTNYVGSFGVPQFVSATLELNATEHFIGSYSIDIYGGPNGTATFVLTNNSSFTSFAYGIGPNWERRTFGPMGNMRQTYQWTECITQ